MAGGKEGGAVIPVQELIELLQEDLTRKSYSFTEYITMSSPYVPKGKEAMVRLLERLTLHEHEHAEWIARLIVDLGGIPNPGLFDEGAADTNYLNIFYLYDLLIRSKEKSIHLFEERLQQCAGYREAEQVIAAIVKQERDQLKELQEMAAKSRTVHGKS